MMTGAIVVEKIGRKPDGSEVRSHWYWCPGCDAPHSITINPDKNSVGAGWTFSGSMECPTYAPSQLTKFGGSRSAEYVCHTFIRNGQIEYLGDCTHEMKGQTVPMVAVPEWLQAEGDPS